MHYSSVALFPNQRELQGGDGAHDVRLQLVFETEAFATNASINQHNFNKVAQKFVWLTKRQQTQYML